MNILVITAQKPDSTGSGVYVAETVRGLASAGHAVSLVAGIDRDDNPDLPSACSFFPVRFRTEELPFPVCGMSDQMPYDATRYRDMTPDMVGRFKRAFEGEIRRACAKRMPDVVLCHHLYLVTAIAAQTIRSISREVGAAAPSVRGICHSTDLRQMATHVLERDFIIEEVRSLSCIFALHEAQKREIVDSYGVDGKRVRVVGSGYNDALFHRSSAPRPKMRAVQVTYVGKIWRKKGVESLIKCAPLLSITPDDIEFHLVGGHNDEVEHAELAELAAASPYRFELRGKVSQDHLIDRYQESDIFVLPSFFEGLPLVVIEALACGCKAVVTDLPGIRPWISRNIPNAPVFYVEPPRMKSIDEPDAADLPAFEARLAHAIEKAAAAPAPRPQDFAGIENVTWSGLADKLIAK